MTESYFRSVDSPVWGFRLALELPLVIQGAFAGDHFKILMEAAEIIEAAFVTELFDTMPVFNQ